MATRTDITKNTYQYREWGSFTQKNGYKSSHLYGGERDIGNGRLVTVRNTDPNWRVKLASRQNASLPYSTEGWTRMLNGATASARVIDPFYDIIDGSLNTTYKMGLPTVQMVRDAATQDIALARLKRKLSKKVGDKALMAPVAELRELRSTASGIAHMATDLVKSLIDIKRTKGKSAAKYASDTWLAWGFGVAPLIGDLKDAASSVQAYLDRKDRTERLTGTYEKTWISSSKTSSNAAFGTAFIEGSWHIAHSYSCRYVAGFELLLESANDYGMLDHFHLNEFGAIIPAIWELVPYSWVYDYVANVGDWLDDTFTSDPSKCLYVVLCERYTADLLGDVQYIKGPNSRNLVFRENDPARYTGTYYSFQRTPLSLLPSRSLRFKTTDEIAKNAFNKLANMASVLIQGTNYRAYRTSLHGMRGEHYSSQYGKQHI